MRAVLLGQGRFADECFAYVNDDEVVLRSSERLTEIPPCDVLLSVMYPYILPASVVLAQPSYNLHNARLPYHRGWNALTHEILRGERWHTVTIHEMSAECDRGDIVYEGTVPILESDSALSLYERCVPVAVRLFRDLLAALRKGERITAFHRPGEGVWHERDMSSLKRVPSLDTATLDRYARAFHFPPHEPAYIEHEGRRTYLVPGGTE